MIPTALFIAMVVLLVATGIASEAYLNLRFTGIEAERTRLTFLAEGSANEFLSGLNRDPAFLSYTASAPKLATSQGVSLTSWSQVETGAPHLRRIFSRAFPTGSPSQARIFTRIVRTTHRATGVIYTNVPDQSPTTPDSVFRKDVNGANWNLLPPPTRMRYTPGGVLESDPTRLAGTILFCGVDDAANFYAVYPPALDGWGFTPASAAFTALTFVYMQAQNGQTLADLAPLTQSVMEDLGTVGEDLSQGALVMKYDAATGLWQPLPPAPNAVDSPAGPIFSPGDFHIRGLCGPLAVNGDDLYVPLFRKGTDAIYKFHFDHVGPTTGSWSLLPPVLGGAGTSVSQVAVDGLGRVFAIASPYPRTGGDNVQELRNGAWVGLPDVPGSYFDGSGKLVESPYSPPFLGAMTAGQDGALYVVSGGVDPLYIDTIFKYAGGTWVAVPSPENLSHAGTGPPSTFLKKSDIGVDCDGKLVVRAGMASRRDEIYVGTGAGYELQPPLPKTGFNSAGVLQNYGGYFNYSSQVLGGGAANTTLPGYLPTASY